MRRNPGVYVRGQVRHADHRTSTPHGWHRVFRGAVAGPLVAFADVNTEGQSKAMKNLAFLD